MRHRRRYKRPILFASLDVLLPDRGPKIKGLSLDVSPEGMRIYSPKALEVNSHITLKIRFEASSREPKTETISAEVKWRKPKSGMHGVRFIYLNPKAHPRLLDILNRMGLRSLQ